MPVKIAAPLMVSPEERAELERMAVSTSLPYRAVVQASGLLLAADGVANNEIARACATTPDTVRRWRAKFEAGRVPAVGTIAPGRGRKPIMAQETIEAIVSDTLHTVPDDGSTEWTTRSMAERHGVGKDFVAKIWKARRLRPWRVDTFKLSTDPRFEEKLVDVIGLYLDPPERAVVFSFDEKTQIQALDRTQPSLPMKPGRGRTMTHDYKRNGTTDLFAALNVGTGEVIAQTRKSHKGTDVLAFFKWIDLHTPRDLEIHVVLDNLSAHKAPAVKEWLAKPAQKNRWHLHFTPTSSSWLNLVEGWFAQLTNKRLRRSAFTSVADLTEAIEHWIDHWNIDPQPFIWAKTANDILNKVHRGRAALTHQTKSATHHYAATAHGNQGETVDVGLAVVTPATSHRSLYVSATRGRDENRLLVVADDPDQAREVLEQVLNNDRVDVPAVVRRRELLEQADSRPGDTGRGGEGPPHRAPQPKPAWEEKREALFTARMDAVERLRPFQDAIEEARKADYAGRDSLSLLQRQLKKAGIFAKSRLREPIAEASETVEAAKVALERAIEAAGPYEEAFYRADRAYEKAARIARIERSRLEVGETQREGPTREAPGLSL